MKIELIPLNDANKADCFQLKVSEVQARNIATNASSFEAAKEHPDVARPFVIYADGIAVGFTMFAFDLACEDPNDRYWLWRFMIDERYQGRGYGKEALNNIVSYFKENGAVNIRLSTKESNVNAIRLYKSVGFRPTGEVIDGETVFELVGVIMGTQSIYEIWEKDGSGVLSVEPLILTACKEEKMGSVFSYPGGCIYKTVFTYLCGKPDEKFLSENPDLIYNSRLVCMSTEWEEYIRKLPIKFILRRELMKPLRAASDKKLKPLPKGYGISAFTKEIFEKHPFDHGRGYADYKDFSERGAGAVILFDGKVVSASSSFLTLEDHVELDVFTDEEHRGKGLADHCVNEMIRQSHAKGLTVHWDAQNPMSSKMAIGHGFVPEAEYAVYWVEK